MSRRRREGIESYTAANQMAMNERESERRSKGFNMRNRRDEEISRASSKSPPETQKGPEGPSRAKRALRAGGALLSRGASPAVPSALAGLTSGFGTGPGVPPPPRPPARGPRSWHSPRCPCGRPGGRMALAGTFSLGSLLASGRAPRRASPGPGPVSGARLRRSRALHLRPIDQVFSLGPRVEGASRGGLRA